MSGYIDLALSQEDIEKQYASNTTLGEAPKYPYGTSFSLDEKTLEHLDYSDWAVGDVFPLDILAKITSISENESSDGKRCCVTFQITGLKGEEHEDEESEEHEFEDGSKVASEGGYLKYQSS